MGKPRMIILIRHAQSEGNKNRDIHQTIPDHRVKLTPEGWTQAHEAGRRLRSLLRADDTLHFFTSPYRRTRETTEGILSTLTSDEPSPTPFPRHSIKVYEEPRLREQDFGNFQPCSNEMERMWQERADYGHFFYRIPNGESAADAYDRVSGFNESLWRQFGDNDFASVCVLVTHGLMSRVFLMKWYHFSVEYFEDLRNVNHCEFLIMRKKEDSGKYILENNLRTWSDLKRERLAALKAKEALPSTQSQAQLQIQTQASSSSSFSQIQPQSNATGTGNGNGNGGPSEKDKEKEKKLDPSQAKKKWGGCPNGCDHSKHYYKKENSMRAMQTHGRPSPTTNTSTTELPFRRPNTRRWQSSSDSENDDPRGHEVARNPESRDVAAAAQHIDIQASLDEIISSPDGTPSFINSESRLHSRLRSLKSPGNAQLKHAGRDFGGSASGNTSETEGSAEEDARKRFGKGLSMTRLVGAGEGGRREESQMGRGVLADKLGDESDAGSEAEEEIEELEKEERSVRGSVY